MALLNRCPGAGTVVYRGAERPTGEARCPKCGGIVRVFVRALSGGLAFHGSVPGHKPTEATA